MGIPAVFDVSFTESALEDLRFLKRQEQKTILEAIEEQLVHDAAKRTRNRKNLRSNDLSAWELRVGAFRVFYDVDTAASEVSVKAIGWKEHNKLFIRGEEFEL